MTINHRPDRRQVLVRAAAFATTGLAAMLGLGGCGTPPPPARLVQLRSEPPPGAASASTRAATPVVPWELAPDLGLPAYLDRETLVLQHGSAGLALLDGQRWAEPLRDALPRVLRADLARLRGGGVWLAPAPTGTAVAQRLRVELQALQADASARVVRLSARWWFTGGASATALREQAVELAVPLADVRDGEAIAVAHRLALWQLAERIVASAPGA
jgi:uncharacterized lipoprotein YmbA